MKRTILALAAIGLLGLAATSASAGSNATVTIRHQVRGCHAWSVNGVSFKAAQTAKVARGASITVVNKDVMAHKLIQTGGAKVAIRTLPSSTKAMSHDLKGPGVMAHTGAAVRVSFAKAGVYTFKTQAGEDYPAMKNMKTIGEDNVLTLKVVVS